MTGQAMTIALKDLTLERRSKANLNALIFLAGLIVVVISFALGPSPTRLRATSGAILWVAFIFASVLAFSRAYQVESENRCFEGMLLAGAAPRAIYAGKVLATMAVMVVVEIVVMVALAVLDGLRLWPAAPGLLLVALLGTGGIAAVGVLYGRLTMTMRAREVMLPLLLFPVVIPAILASVRATAIILAGSTHGLGSWIELLVVFDVVFLSAGLLTFEALCRE